MLVRFSSTKTESITMFGDVAVQLIKMLGATGAVPGAIGADDIPTAVEQLRQQVRRRDSAATETVEDGNEEDREPTIALGTRAGPLIDILERAGAAHVPVMWEKL